MKTLQEIVNESNINESGEKFNDSLKSHKEVYNKLLKWYDKATRYMNKDEVISCLEYAIDHWKNDDFDEL